MEPRGMPMGKINFLRENLSSRMSGQSDRAYIGLGGLLRGCGLGVGGLSREPNTSDECRPKRYFADGGQMLGLCIIACLGVNA